MKVVPLEGTTMTIRELGEFAKDEAIILTRDGQPSFPSGTIRFRLGVDIAG